MGTLSKIYKAAKTEIKKAIKSKPKSTAKPASKSTAKPASKSTVKPKTIDFKKAKRTLAATAGVGAGVGGAGTYLATKDKKPEAPKKVIDATGSKKFGDAFSEARKSGKTEFTWNGKKYNTKLADDKKVSQDAKPNESNAPSPDYTPKKTETKKEEKFDRMKAAREQMERARESMGMGSRFGYKKGGKVKPGYHKMPNGKMMKDSEHKGMKKMKAGGKVRGDGICSKGKTKGRII